MFNKPWVRIALAGAVGAVLIDHLLKPTINKSFGV
jgi:hypothetical protein